MYYHVPINKQSDTYVGMNANIHGQLVLHHWPCVDTEGWKKKLMHLHMHLHYISSSFCTRTVNTCPAVLHRQKLRSWGVEVAGATLGWKQLSGFPDDLSTAPQAPQDVLQRTVSLGDASEIELRKTPWK